MCAHTGREVSVRGRSGEIERGKKKRGSRVFSLSFFPSHFFSLFSSLPSSFLSFTRLRFARAHLPHTWRCQGELKRYHLAYSNKAKGTKTLGTGCPTSQVAPSCAHYKIRQKLVFNHTPQERALCCAKCQSPSHSVHFLVCLPAAHTLQPHTANGTCETQLRHTSSRKPLVHIARRRAR